MPRAGGHQVGAADGSPAEARRTSPGASPDSEELERKRLKAERREKKRAKREGRGAAGRDASPDGDDVHMTVAGDSDQVKPHNSVCCYEIPPEDHRMSCCCIHLPLT